MSGNFRENLIFANSVKRHTYGVKNSRLGHDVPISVNDRKISPFREHDFHEISHSHMRSFAKITARENFRIYTSDLYWTSAEQNIAHYQSCSNDSILLDKSATCAMNSGERSKPIMVLLLNLSSF